MGFSVDINSSGPVGIEGVAKAIGVRLVFCVVIEVPFTTRSAMRVGAMDCESSLYHDNNNKKETHSHLTCYS